MSVHNIIMGTYQVYKFINCEVINNLFIRTYERIYYALL